MGDGQIAAPCGLAMTMEIKGGSVMTTVEKGGPAMTTVEKDGTEVTCEGLCLPKMTDLIWCYNTWP